MKHYFKTENSFGYIENGSPKENGSGGPLLPLGFEALKGSPEKAMHVPAGGSLMPAGVGELPTRSTIDQKPTDEMVFQQLSEMLAIKGQSENVSYSLLKVEKKQIMFSVFYPQTGMTHYFTAPYTWTSLEGLVIDFSLASLNTNNVDEASMMHRNS